MIKSQLEKSFSNLSQKSDTLEHTLDEMKQENDALHISLNNMSDTIEKLQIMISSIEEGLCLNSWLRFQSSCYMVSAVETDWNNSRRTCRENNADLVIIDSKEEQEFLIGVGKDSKEVWIGLSDSDQEGTWKWVDGTPFTEGFWRSGEPNDSNGNEDCAVLNLNIQAWSVRGNPTTSLQAWNDIPCYRSIPSICERKL
ncbi:C-type lectin domain family 4 member E-like [Engraulis encrasicolus]|uniref:C-type lectin domain family 4 member E-like n=1 Tax=Engraulis encrasicolus TaxID=184585 RepID=UPI002FD67F50